MELMNNQIKAINDAMSFLTTIWCIKDTSILKEHFTKHLRQLLDSGVDKDVVEHFDRIMHSHLNYVKEYGPYCD